jgi:hypothetical protein
MLAFNDPTDSTFVIDPGVGRLTVFDPRGRYVRASHWAGVSPGRAMIASARSFIVPNAYATRSSFGFPLHEFTFEGTLLRSFGARGDQTIKSARELPHLRVPSRTHADGSYWTVEALRPILTRWSRSGDPLETWLLPLKDFVPLVGMQPDSPRGFEFLTLDHGTDGIVWLMMAVSDPRAGDAFGPRKIVDGRSMAILHDYGSYFDTRIFALDPRTRSVIAYRDVPEYVANALGNEQFWAVGPGGDMGVLRVLRVSLHR